MKKILAYLVIFILLIAIVALGIVSVLLYANQNTLNSRIDQLNQQLDSERNLNKTLQDLLSKSSSGDSSSSNGDNTSSATKTYTSSNFDIRFDYPISFGDAKSQVINNTEYVSFSSSEITLHFPGSEGGFSPEGYNVETVKTKDLHEFKVYTPMVVVDSTDIKPSVNAFYTNSTQVVNIFSYATKASLNDVTDQIKDIIKSMSFTLTKK